MLAAKCPHCGAPTPVSLAAPDTIACQQCGRVGPAPEVVTAELHQARDELRKNDSRRRQLTSLQRRLIGSRVVGCLHSALLFLLTAPFVVNTSFCLVEEDTPAWVTAASLAPILAMVIIGGLGAFWIRRARNSLLQACSAVPPQTAGHAARCHVCGAPVHPEAGEPVTRCSFCDSDNIVLPEAMRDVSEQQHLVLGAYAQAVQRSVASLATSSLASKLFAVAIAVIGPVLTILVTIAVALSLEHIHVAPNLGRSYAVWSTGDGRCLGRVRIRDGKTQLTFNMATLRGIRDPVTVNKGMKLTTLTAPELVGKSVFYRGGVATVKNVFRALGSKSNQAELELVGESAETAIAGLCLADEPVPEQLAKLEHSGSRHLAVDETRLYWTDGEAVRALPKGGGSAVVLTGRSGSSDLLAADTTHLYVGDTGAVVAIDKGSGEEKKLADTGESIAAPRAMCLDATHVYYALKDAVWRVPKVGGKAPERVVESPESSGLVVHRGELVFYSPKTGSIQSVPVTGGTTRTLASGLKLPSDLPMFVDGEDISFVNGLHQLMEVPFRAGIPKRIVSFGEKPDGYVRAGIHVVFWVNGSSVGEGGGVFHARAGSPSKPRNLAPTTAQVSGLAIDGAYAYWIDDVTGRVMRVKLPKVALPTLRKPLKRPKAKGKDGAKDSGK